MKGEINSALVTSWPIVENNRLGGYRLKVEPGKIRIDSEALRRHPDYEVRCLADEPGQSGQPQVH